MAGFFGEDWDDPRTLGALNFAARLASAPSVAEGFLGGGLDYANTLRQARDAALHRRLQMAQLNDVEQQAALRKAQAAKQGRLLDAISQWSDPSGGDFFAGQSALGAAHAAGGAPGPTIQAASMIPQARAQQQSRNPFLGVPPEAVQADLAFNEGKGISEMLFKRSAPQMENVNGVWFDKNRVAPGTSVPRISENGQAAQVIPDPTAPGGYRVIAPAGAVDTYAAYRNADEQAKARSDLVKVWDPGQQRERYLPRSQVLGGAAPAGGQGGLPLPTRNNNPGAMRGPGGAFATFETPEQGLAAMDANLRAYVDKHGIDTIAGVVSRWAPPSENDTGAYIKAVSQRLGVSPTQKIDLRDARVRQAVSTAIMLHESGPQGVFGAQQQGGQSGAGSGMAAGPSATEKNAADAQGEVNKSWLKTSYEPTLGAGDAATNMLTNVQTARYALQGVGKTGWGTDAQAGASRVLAGLGIPQSSQMAGSAEIFRSAASTRLWEVLNTAKGPQTEGDAQRAQATFAQLGNQPQANQFILDLAQATAERDRQKAAFYRDALPMAQKAGDLAKVDREWQKLQPSVWAMPVMQKWNRGQ